MLDQLTPPVRGLMIDMDGVLWKDSTPIGDLLAVFNSIKSKGLKLTVATNNATMTVEENLEKLRGFGVHLEPQQVVTSSEATAHTLASRLPGKGAIFVVGEGGVIKALGAHGFDVISDALDETKVVAVVAGIDRALTYQKLRRAAAHVRAGALFFGTNPDKTFPMPDGLVPGAGSILAAIAAAADVEPVVIGKPALFMFQLSAERMHLSRNEVLVIGDRLETDVAGGQAFGARTALVLSGVSTRAQAATWKPAPNLIAADLAQLIGV
jgi:4-nitrophenyl phosphatase